MKSFLITIAIILFTSIVIFTILAFLKASKILNEPFEKEEENAFDD